MTQLNEHQRSTVNNTANTDKVYGIEKMLLQKIINLFGCPPVTIVLWNGEEIYKPQHKPVARIVFHNRHILWNFFISPDLAFGDGYSAGSITVEGDLGDLCAQIIRAKYISNSGFSLKRYLLSWFNRPSRNSIAESCENIYAHYDIDNDFFKLWLDKQMVYTCAYYPRSDMTLEAAQCAKMDHICKKLQLQPGQAVVEAGCGWGALALYMAKHYGVNVKAYNISHQQIAYAKACAKAEGLFDRVEYIEDDFRNITGNFDVFVSVGMLEHVGTYNYREFGKLISRCLKRSGRGLIHSIGRNKAFPNNVWLEKRIFPGSDVPSLRKMMDLFELSDFSVLDVENLRMHYAKTLQHWLERFDKADNEITEKFDTRFVRAWRLYLTGTMASFTVGSLQLFQIVFTRSDNNDIPWDRGHIYSSESNNG